VSTTKILTILEAAHIEAPKARAIAESLEMALKEQEDGLSNSLMTKLDAAELRRSFEALKAEILKWMFIFWVGQLAALIAVAKFVLRN
jgi:hypothetical protein